MGKRWLSGRGRFMSDKRGGFVVRKWEWCVVFSMKMKGEKDKKKMSKRREVIYGICP